MADSDLPRGPSELPAKACVLVVLDGWGIAPDGPGNAISLADTPVFDELWSTYPHSQLIACGRAVGLPEGQMGNSEVGHMNLGAGAVVMQDLTRIDEAATSGGFESNDVLRAAFSDAERVHLIGLVSDGGVHSGFQHLEALIRMAAALGVATWCSTRSPTGATRFRIRARGIWRRSRAGWRMPGVGRIGSVVGRYWAMDRDKRWDRTQRAYDLLVHGRAEHRAASGVEAATRAYEREETDEFITPVLVGDEARIRPGDSVFAFNFRPDRMREITRALAEPGFDEIDRGGAEAIERYATMTQYEEDFEYPVAFAPEHPSMTLPKALGQRGVRQLHVAETEKYAHVTYFFSCGEEEPYPGERRELVPSNREVPTYDHAPEMSAPQAAEAFVRAWREDSPTFGIINFANSDMVGHTGVIEAAVRGIETVDRALGEVVAAVHESGGAVVITADHGNSDHMLEDDGSPNTAHSLNPVPLIVTVPGVRLREEGILADVAPTVLKILGFEQPDPMTGRSMIED